MKTITEIIGGAQSLLDVDFDLQKCFEEYLTDSYKSFLHILRVAETYMQKTVCVRSRMGRPSYPYEPYIRGELAKRHFHIDKTKDLIERLKNDPNLRLLCGFRKVPHKSSFSRALAVLSELPIFDNALDALVKDAHKDIVVYHTCRDSTAIPAREKPEPKIREKSEKPSKKRGRPPKNAKKQEKKPTVLEKQLNQTPQKSLAEIDKNCAWGCKKNSEGNVHFWKGYKLHLDVSDIGFPLTACVTGANVHDSRLAIPMEQLTEQKVTFLYSLMDAGYDASIIDAFIRSRERVPIIDPNKRKNNDRPPLDPAKKERFKIRSTVERSNSDLKDNIPKAIYVKGFSKVSFVLMSAVLCLAAVKYLQHFIL
jgi:transposase